MKPLLIAMVLALVVPLSLLVRAQPLRSCIYTNEVTCDNALPKADCNANCLWMDDHYAGEVNFAQPETWPAAWGYHGRWSCPDGMIEDVQVRTLHTTILRDDAEDWGWLEDKWAQPDNCNERYLCRCFHDFGPRDPLFSVLGVPPCEKYGPPLPVPQGTFREPEGEPNCHPAEPTS